MIENGLTSHGLCPECRVVYAHMLDRRYFGKSGHELIAATERRVRLLRTRYEVCEMWTCAFVADLRRGGALAHFAATYQWGGCTIVQREYTEEQMCDDIHARRVHGEYTRPSVGTCTLRAPMIMSHAHRFRACHDDGSEPPARQVGIHGLSADH